MAGNIHLKHIESLQPSVLRLTQDQNTFPGMPKKLWKISSISTLSASKNRHFKKKTYKCGSNVVGKLFSDDGKGCCEKSCIAQCFDNSYHKCKTDERNMTLHKREFLINIFDKKQWKWMRNYLQKRDLAYQIRLLNFLLWKFLHWIKLLVQFDSSIGHR